MVVLHMGLSNNLAVISRLHENKKKFQWICVHRCSILSLAAILFLEADILTVKPVKT